MGTSLFGLGAKFTVDGESEFKKSLSNINTALKEVDSASKLVSEQYKKNQNSVEALTKQSTLYNEKINLQKEKVKSLADACEELAKQEDVDEKKLSQYQTQLNKATTDLMKMQGAYDDTNKQLKEHQTVMGKAKDAYAGVKEKVNQLKEAYPKLTKAVETAAKVAKGVGKAGFEALKVGAKSAVAAFSAVTAGAVALGKAVFNSAQQASEYGDVIDKASQRMGIATDSYQELAHAADLSGVSMGTMEQAAKNLAKSGSDLTLDKAIQQVAAIKDPAERSAKAVELFGSKAGYQLAPMLNAGSDGIKGMMKEAKNLGLVMSSDAVEASAKFNDTLSTMKDTVNQVKNNIAAEFMPGINDVMEGITGLFSGDESAASKIEEGVKNIMGTLGEQIPVIVNIFNNIIDAVVDIAPEIINSLASGLTGSIDKLVTAAMELVNVLVNSLLTQENIQAIMNGAIGIITTLVKFLSGNADLLVNTAFTLVTSLVDGLLEDNNLDILIDSTIGMVGAIVTGLIDNAPKLITAAFELAKALAEALLTYDWIGLAKQIFGSIKNALKSLIGAGDSTNTPIATVPTSVNGSHSNGLAYVPYDGYVAKLHQGERVLTAAESTELKMQTSSKDTEDAVYRGMQKALKNQKTSDNGGEYTFVAQLDGKTLFNEVVKQNNSSYKNKGYSPIKV